MFRIKKILQLVIAACLFITSTTAIAQTWTSLNGPQIAKNVKDISLSGDFVYIAENEYLLKSINGGTAWKATPSVFTTPSVVLCKPTDASIVIGSRQNFFKRSIDGGNNWDNVIPSTIADNLTPLRLSASSVNTSNMFLGRKYDASTKSVWRSLNEGALWEPCNNFTWATDVYDVAPYPVNIPERNNYMWVCGSDPSGQEVVPKNPSAISYNKGAWFSPDAGVSWEAQPMGTYNLKSIAIVHKPYPSPYHLFVVTSQGEIWKSTNNGVSWLLNYSTSNTARLIRVNNNTTPNTVLLATSTGIYRSLDEGAAWSQANNGLGTDINILSLSIQPLSNTIIIGTANSIYKSTNNGDTWVNVGMMNASSVAAYSGTVWSVTRDNNYSGKYISPTWSNVSIGNVGEGFRSEHILSKSSTDLFVSGALNNAASLFRSTNSGNSYFPVVVSTPLPTSGKFLGTANNPGNNDIWLHGGGSINGTWRMLLKSADGGNWTIMSPVWQQDGLYANDLLVLNVGSGRLFAALSDGKVYRSDDNGVSWGYPATLDLNVEPDFVVPAQAVAANPQLPSIVYACGTKGLWRSASYGDAGSWILKRTDDVKRILMHPSYNSTDYLWVVAAGGNKIFKTTNGGSNWVEVNTDILPKPIYDIRKDIGNDSLMNVATASGVYKINPPPESPTNLVGSIENNHPKITWNANIETDLKLTGFDLAPLFWTVS